MKNILLMALILPILLLSACTTETATVTAPPITVTAPLITVTAPPITVTAPPITITVTPSPPAELYIVTENLSYKITEKTTNYWYYSWQISIKNMTSQALTLYIEIHFLDAEGFSVEWDNDIVELNSQEEKTLRGTAMVSVPLAADIVGAVADIEFLY